MADNLSNPKPAKTRIQLSDELRAALKDPQMMPRNVTLKGIVYTLVDHGGDGYKGVVWQAKDDIGRARAIKFTISEDYEDRSYLQEITRVVALEPYPEFARFEHAQLYTLKFPTLGERTFVCFVEEWINEVTLKKYLKEHAAEIGPSFMLGYVRGLCSALSALNATALKHDDMHSGNVMVADPPAGDLAGRLKIKVIDTGSLKPQTQQTNKLKDDHRNFVEHLLDIWNAIHRRKMLSVRDRRFLRSTKGLLKSMLDDDPSTRLRDPRQILEQFEHAYTRAGAPPENGEPRLLGPFEFLSAEHIADDRVLVDLFARSVPWFDKVAGPDPCLVTGPRGCGKSTIFRWLSLKAHLHKSIKEIEELRIAGFYISCSADLQNRIGWIDTDGLAKRFEREIVHYFNLLTAREVVQTLALISRSAEQISHFGIGVTEEKKIYDFVLDGLYLASKPLLQGVPRLDQIAEAIEREMFSTHRQMLKGESVELCSPETFLADLSGILSQCPFFRRKRITFLIDDFSVHRIPESVQQVLNRIIWERQSSHIFKLSSEKLGAILQGARGLTSEASREMVEIDCGREFIVLEDLGHISKIKKFAIELLNHRLTSARFAGTAETLISDSQGESLALSLRNKRGRTPHYHGLDRIAALCSGDISTLLLVFRRIFEAAGEDQGTTSRVLPSLQDSCVRAVAREFVIGIKAFVPYGIEMHDIVLSFGTLVKNILVKGNLQKEGKISVPVQCPRIEIDQGKGGVTDRLSPVQQKLASELLRRAIFIDMGPGLSRHGGVPTMRWHLRRVYLPAFGAGLHKNNAVKPPADWLKYFLSDPKGACDLEWQKWPHDGLKGRRADLEDELSLFEQ